MKSKRRRLCFSKFDGVSHPQSLLDLQRWPNRVLDGMRAGDAACNAECELRLYLLYAGRCLFTTDYMGWECPWWGMTCIPTALIKQWKWDEDVVKNGITFTRSCDFGDIQQRVLCKVAEDIDDGKSCVLHNIMDRLPVKAPQFAL